jgi:hypothetical protein
MLFDGRVPGEVPPSYRRPHDQMRRVHGWVFTKKCELGIEAIAVREGGRRLEFPCHKIATKAAAKKIIVPARTAI